MEGSAVVPVEGFFLPPASVKAQKVAKGKRRNGTSISISIKKAIHETWKRLKGYCLYSTNTAIKWVGRPARLLLHVFVRRALSWSFDQFCFLCFCSGFSLKDF